MKRHLSLALSIIMMLAAFAACTGTGAPATTQSAQGTTAADGTTAAPGTTAPANPGKDTYTMGLYAEATSVDPALSKDRVTWIICYQIYDTLVKFDMATQSYAPGLASSWEISADSTEVVFEIRQDVKFHNGDTMTTDDALWSLQRALESTFTSSLTGSMDHFEKVDDTHIKLVLKYAYAPIMDVLVTPCFGIASKRAVEETEAAGQDFGRIGCGTGAYMLTNWRSGERMDFVAFDDYYEGAPAIKNVTVLQIPDAGSGAIALEDGTVDAYLFLQQSDFRHLESLPHLQKVETAGGVGIQDITFNVTDGIFTDKRLRQAVAYAINREDMLLGGVEGYGIISNVPCAVSSFGQMDYAWYQQDQEKARQLLAEAGYANGLDITFQMEGSIDYMKPAEIMQDQLRQVGINVTFEKMERAAWIEQVSTIRNFTASLRMTTMAINDVDYLLSRRLHSESLGGGNNYSGYANPDFEALVVKARTLSDPTQRLDLYRQCYDMIKEDVPYIPLYSETNPIYINAKLMGFINHPQNRTPWSTLYFVD